MAEMGSTGIVNITHILLKKKMLILSAKCKMFLIWHYAIQL